MIYNYESDFQFDIKNKQNFLINYESINEKVNTRNLKDLSYLYDNKNNIFFYFIQKNFKNGNKLKYCSIVFNILKLLQRYSQYGAYKNKDLLRFTPGFNFYYSLVNRYNDFLPNFTLKLECEYKGKHKTRRKYMYSVFLDSFRSKINELSIWFKRISFKYKYRSYYTRLSIIFFNYIYFLRSEHNKIYNLSNTIFNMQRGSKKFFLSDNSMTDSSTQSDTYKKALIYLTKNRLKIKLKPRIDSYYKSIVYTYKNNLSYVMKHSSGKIKIEKYLKMLYKSELITKKEYDNGKLEYQKYIRK